uniref:Uncharacterized protein n=1 Tax=Cannabis sativa TaxID=3483 RepID=A0A803R8S9_CANSA
MMMMTGCYEQRAGSGFSSSYVFSNFTILVLIPPISLIVVFFFGYCYYDDDFYLRDTTRELLRVARLKNRMY